MIEVIAIVVCWVVISALIAPSVGRWIKRNGDDE